MNWQVTYWSGSGIGSVIVWASDMYSLASAISASPAGSYMYNIIKVERLPNG